MLVQQDADATVAAWILSPKLQIEIDAVRYAANISILVHFFHLHLYLFLIFVAIFSLLWYWRSSKPIPANWLRFRMYQNTHTQFVWLWELVRMREWTRFVRTTRISNEIVPIVRSTSTFKPSHRVVTRQLLCCSCISVVCFIIKMESQKIKLVIQSVLMVWSQVSLSRCDASHKNVLSTMGKWKIERERLNVLLENDKKLPQCGLLIIFVVFFLCHPPTSNYSRIIA